MQLITSIVAGALLLLLTSSTSILSTSAAPNALQLTIFNRTPYVMRVVGVNQTARQAQWVLPDERSFLPNKTASLLGVVSDDPANRGDLFAILDFLVAFPDEIVPFQVLIDDRAQIHLGSSIFGVASDRLNSTYTATRNPTVGPWLLSYSACTLEVLPL